MKLEIASPEYKNNIKLPFYACAVTAGFPSPADDFVEQKLDLNELMIDKPSATFFVRVAGDSMIGAGIFAGDLLVVDRSKDAKNGSVVVAIVNGEFTVKHFYEEDGKISLRAHNPNYPAIEITEGSEFEVWGVATNVIHSLK